MVVGLQHNQPEKHPTTMSANTQSVKEGFYIKDSTGKFATFYAGQFVGFDWDGTPFRTELNARTKMDWAMISNAVVVLVGGGQPKHDPVYSVVAPPLTFPQITETNPAFLKVFTFTVSALAEVCYTLSAHKLKSVGSYKLIGQVEAFEETLRFFGLTKLDTDRIRVSLLDSEDRINALSHHILY